MTSSKMTQEVINKYLKRFEGTVPLVVYPQGLYLDKCRATFIESEIDLEYGHCQIRNIEPNKEYKIIAGFEKAKLDDFINYDWLLGGDRLPDLFNKFLIKKMQKICSNDFISLPVTLINLSDKVEPYKNKDFYVVNALNTLDAINREKSSIYTYSSGTENIEKRVYKENPWQGHSIAFNSSTLGMIYHPKLAKELYPSKQFHFLTPEEDSYWNLGGFPKGYDKNSYIEWMRIMNSMASPGKLLLNKIKTVKGFESIQYSGEK